MYSVIYIYTIYIHRQHRWLHWKCWSIADDWIRDRWGNLYILYKNSSLAAAAAMLAIKHCGRQKERKSERKMYVALLVPMVRANGDTFIWRERQRREKRPRVARHTPCTITKGAGKITNKRKEREGKGKGRGEERRVIDRYRPVPIADATTVLWRL